MTTDKKYNFRTEEAPVIGQFLLDSYLADEADFRAFSPQFDEAFKADYIAKLNAVKEIINPKVLTAELKGITARMYDNLDRLREELNRSEAYVKLSKAKLQVSLKDFKFKEIRRSANNKDFEKLIEELKMLAHLLNEHLNILQEKGFTQEMLSALENLRQAFDADNAEQNRKLDERRQHVAANTETVNTFYEKIAEILAIGKVMYKKSQAEKAKSYTLSALQKRVRNSRKTKGEEKPIPSAQNAA